MIKIALTGSIGMGKSTVAAMFAEAGIPLFDADAEVRRMQAFGGSLVEAIGDRFPGTMIGGAIDRDLLAAHVLDDRDELAALEMIVHPAVAEARQRFIEAHRDAPADVQRRRVMARKGMTGDKYASILARQLPDAAKRERADFVVDTGRSLDETRAQVNEILTCLGLRAAR